MALFFVYFLGGLESVGHSFAFVAYFVFSRDVWIRTQRAAVASMRATKLASHLPNLAAHLPSYIFCPLPVFLTSIKPKSPTFLEIGHFYSETHIERQATRHDWLLSLLGDGDK
jgi:hypothetical protein